MQIMDQQSINNQILLRSLYNILTGSMSTLEIFGLIKEADKMNQRLVTSCKSDQCPGGLAV